MSKPVRVGLIGSQFISTIHARSLAHCPNAEVVAVTSPTPGNASSFGEAFGIPHRFTDHREMFAMDDLDMVVVGAPMGHSLVTKAPLYQLS